MSSGGVSPQQKIPIGPGYQVGLAEALKRETGLPTIAVGLITEPEQAEAIVAGGQADLVALARGMLFDPRWPWHAAAQLGAHGGGAAAVLALAAARHGRPVRRRAHRHALKETPMKLIDLQGKRVLITQAQEFMGPALQRVFGALGATVIADARPLGDDASLAVRVVAEAGDIDVLIAHLALPAPSTAVAAVDDDEWRHVFAHLVDPLPRLARAVLPQFTARGAGRIVVIGSAAALRGQKRTSTYSAARGAQLAWVRAAGVELARQNIQLNAIAQNFVDNPTYFPPEVQANPAFQERLKREVPLGRLVAADEDALFAAYLASDAAACFVGQVFPVCGGWVS